MASRMSLMREVRVEPAGFLRRDRCIRRQTLVRLGQVDEVVDPRLQQGPQPGRGLIGALCARVFTGSEASGNEPVAVGQRAIVGGA